MIFNRLFFSNWREHFFFICVTSKILITPTDSTFYFMSFESVVADTTTVLSSYPCQSLLECSVICLSNSQGCVGFDYDTHCVTYSAITSIPIPTTNKVVYIQNQNHVTTTALTTTTTSTTTTPTTTTSTTTTTTATTTPPTTTTIATTTAGLVIVKDCHEHGNVFNFMSLDGIIRCIRPVNEQFCFGDEANPYCVPFGSAVALETKQKIDDFRNFLKGKGLWEASGYWVGLNDIDNEGQYIWDKHGQQAPSTGDIWEGGAPASGTDKNCIALIGEGYLVAQNCFNMHRYVCEIEIYAT